MRITLITAATAALALGGCGPQAPEDVRSASIAKCERQFGRMTPDPALDPASFGAMCTCMTDRLTEEGMEITDFLGEGRDQVAEITRSCARQTGVQLPEG